MYSPEGEGFKVPASFLLGCVVESTCTAVLHVLRLERNVNISSTMPRQQKQERQVACDEKFRLAPALDMLQSTMPRRSETLIASFRQSRPHFHAKDSTLPCAATLLFSRLLQNQLKGGPVYFEVQLQAPVLPFRVYTAYS